MPISYTLESGASSGDIIQIIRRDAEDAKRDAHVQRAEGKNKIWNNDFADLVETELKEQVSLESYEHLRFFIHTSTNLLREIAWQTAINYDRPARRYVAQEKDEDAEETTAAPAEGEETEVVEQRVPGQDGLEHILSFEDRDALMAEVERLCTKVHEFVVVRSVERRGRLEHDIFTPALIRPVCDPDDPTRAIAYHWTVQEKRDGKLVKITRYWDETQWLTIAENGLVLAGEANPYGRLPFTVFRRGRVFDSFGVPGVGDDLYEATIEVCILKTYLSRAFRVSSFKQLMTDGDVSKIPPRQTMDASSALSIPGGQVTMIGYGPEGGLVQHLEALRQWEERIAVAHGVSPNLLRGTSTPESGAAKRAEMARIVRQALEVRKYLVESEVQLLEADRAVCEAHGLIVQGELPVDAKIVVDPAEPEFDEPEQEKAAREDRELRLGLVSVIDLMKRRNPELSDEEAEKTLRRNQRTNRLAGATGGTPPAAPGGGGLAAIMQRMRGGAPPEDEA